MYVSIKQIVLNYSLLISIVFMVVTVGCQGTGKPSDKGHRFMVIDPGHFHAGMVFKRAGYPGVSNDVAIYAPVGDDITDHMARVMPFNTRKENPASWIYIIKLNDDYLEQMINDKFGDVVVLAGKNDKKIDRILASVKAGYNVLSDKPWVIEPDKFKVLEEVVAEAEKRNLKIKDIMTERYEITTILQKLIVGEKSVFGEITKGTKDNPAVVKKSIHHFSKKVSGKQLKRSWWYFDTNVQGEGLVDVTTHLTDLVFLILFPDRAIDYKKDVKVVSAEHWATILDAKQFEKVTLLPEFPSQFKLDSQGKYHCYCNGKFVFTVDGINCEMEVIWNYEAPAGTGDTHYSIIKGTKANILILQGKEQNFKPELYVEPAPGADSKTVEEALTAFIGKLNAGDYPGVSVSREGKYLKINIDDKYKVGHEAHFGQVTDAFLEYLDGKKPVPEWENVNLLAKYYVTTQALKLCREGK